MKYLALTFVIAASPVWADRQQPAGSAPAESYRSVFDDYKAIQDEALRDWRQANDEMGRLRGHMGHLNVTSHAPE